MTFFIFLLNLFLIYFYFIKIIKIMKVNLKKLINYNENSFSIENDLSNKFLSQYSNSTYKIRKTKDNFTTDSNLFNLQKNNCIFCQNLSSKFYSFNMINIALYHKYSSSQNYFYSREISPYINNSSHIKVINFKDLVDFEENEDYLTEFFISDKIKKKINFLGEFYKFHNEIPRFFMFPLLFLINTYYDKKRRVEYFRVKKLLQKKKIEGENMQLINHSILESNFERIIKFTSHKTETLASFLNNTNKTILELNYILQDMFFLKNKENNKKNNEKINDKAILFKKNEKSIKKKLGNSQKCYNSPLISGKNKKNNFKRKLSENGLNRGNNFYEKINFPLKKNQKSLSQKNLNKNKSVNNLKTPKKIINDSKKRNLNLIKNLQKDNFFSINKSTHERKFQKKGKSLEKKKENSLLSTSKQTKQNSFIYISESKGKIKDLKRKNFFMDKKIQGEIKGKIHMSFNNFSKTFSLNKIKNLTHLAGVSPTNNQS